MILFFDIDGTILDYDGKMPQSTYKALLLARENGHKLILCTGRCKCGVKQLTQKVCFDGIICSAGAHVEYGGEMIFHNILSPAEQEKLIGFFEQAQAVYGLQTNENIVCPETLRPFFEEFSDDAADDPEKLDDLGKTFLFVNDIRKINNVEKAFFYGANVGLRETQKRLSPVFEVRPASYNMPDPNNGEICLNGITKSYGMQKLLDHLKISREDTVAFGDGHNDIEMLEYAGIGVAVGNAVDELKDIADYVTDAISEGGMWNAMKYFKFI